MNVKTSETVLSYLPLVSLIAMSVVLATGKQDFVHQVSSFSDSKSFYDNLSMDGGRLASNLAVGSTSDNSCASNSSSDSPREEDHESYNFNPKKVYQSCDYVDGGLIESTESLLLEPSPGPDYESDFNYEKESIQSRLGDAKSGIESSRNRGTGVKSLRIQSSEVRDKDTFHKSTCPSFNCYNGVQESGNILFVSGFNLETTVSQLVNLFGDCGVLKSNHNGDPDIHIHLDRVTGKSRGQATVAFKTNDAAQSAIKRLNDRDNLGGRLSVQPYRKKTWIQRRDPYFGCPREHLPCRCCSWPRHPANSFYEPVYPDTRLSSRSYHGGYHGANGYRSDTYSRIPCYNSYFEQDYSRNHVRRDGFQYQRRSSEMSLPEANDMPYFNCHPRNDRPCWNVYQRNCHSMGGHGGYALPQNHSRDYYPRSIYGRGRLVSERERAHKSWSLDAQLGGDHDKYGERYAYHH